MNARHLLLVFGLGVFVGALASVAVLHTTRARHAWARGTMQVLAHQHGALKRALAARTCSRETLPRNALPMLEALSNEIPLAMNDVHNEFAFQSALKDFRRGLDLAKLANDCNTLSDAVQQMNTACQACHARFK